MNNVATISWKTWLRSFLEVNQGEKTAHIQMAKSKRGRDGKGSETGSRPGLRYVGAWGHHGSAHRRESWGLGYE